jgi:hypothetical protein
MKFRTFIMIVPFCLLMAAGCAQTPILVPAPDSSLQVTGMTAVDKVKGVSVAASGDKWKGDVRVRDFVTPLEVTINNRHGSLLKISYSLFSLRDTSGNLYSALPPYSVKGTIREYASSYYCPGFYVAPYYSRFYPSMPAYEDPFYYDPFYYDYYYPCWRNINLPTPEMLDEALPEGVLRNGTEATGFLYFEKIGKADHYTFEMDLVDAKTGERFGTVSIPFIKKK